MQRARMRNFWDRRAREDAFYFVDNRLRYGEPDRDWFWAQGEADLDTLLKLAGASLRPSDRVVEIGCGVGRLTRPIAARAATVKALDVSTEMLDVARRENPALSNVEWILGDGATLTGVADRSADVCLSHVVFQHIPDPRVTLGYVEEMGRVLRPGGWSAFQVSNDPALHRRPPILERLRRELRSLRGRAPHGQSARTWLGSPIALEEVRAAAARGRMRIERVVGAGSQFCVVRAIREYGSPSGHGSG